MDLELIKKEEQLYRVENNAVELLVSELKEEEKEKIRARS
jgi:hypothetical protein